MMKLFHDPAMMEQLTKAMSPADEFGKFKDAQKLLASATPDELALADDIVARSTDPIAAVTRAERLLGAKSFVDNFPLGDNLRQLAGVRRNMKAMVRQKFAGTPDMERFIQAIDRFCDPRSPGFAATRDFGSHSLNYKGVALQGDQLVATFQVNEVFNAVGKAFGNPKMQASAAMKVLDDFGYAVPQDKIAQFAKRLGGLGDETVKVEKLVDEGLVVVKKGANPDTTFVFEGAGTAAATSENVSLANTLQRQTALKDALAQLDAAPRTQADFQRVISTVVDQFDDSYVLTTQGTTMTAPQVFNEAGLLIKQGKLAEAQQLIQKLRDYGRGTMRNAA